MRCCICRGTELQLAVGLEVEKARSVVHLVQVPGMEKLSPV